MSDVFGTDISQSNGDWGTTSTGDVATVSGPDNLQQALERRWSTRRGALFYAPDYGNDIFDMLSQPINNDWIDRATAASKVCLMGDPRVADVQVTVTPNPEKRTVLFTNQWTAVDGTTGTVQQEVTTYV